MDLFKNPFSKHRENEQLTPGLAFPEKAKQPETAQETHKEKPVSTAKLEKSASPDQNRPVGKDKPSLKTATQSASSQSILQQKIEIILQEDLEQVYFNMDQAHRRMFKEEGERVAQEVRKILAIGKSAAVKILELIRQWLRLVPGVNKFFIEQEAKIKTDKIIKINQL